MELDKSGGNKEPKEWDGLGGECGMNIPYSIPLQQFGAKRLFS